MWVVWLILGWLVISSLVALWVAQLLKAAGVNQLRTEPMDKLRPAPLHPWELQRQAGG